MIMDRINFKVGSSFWFEGIIFDNGEIDLDINCSCYDYDLYCDITKEKAKEIIEFLTKFVGEE